MSHTYMRHTRERMRISTKHLPGGGSPYIKGYDSRYAKGFSDTRELESRL